MLEAGRRSSAKRSSSISSGRLDGAHRRSNVEGVDAASATWRPSFDAYTLRGATKGNSIAHALGDLPEAVVEDHLLADEREQRLVDGEVDDLAPTVALTSRSYSATIMA